MSRGRIEFVLGVQHDEGSQVRTTRESCTVTENSPAPSSLVTPKYLSSSVRSKPRWSRGLKVLLPNYSFGWLPILFGTLKHGVVPKHPDSGKYSPDHLRSGCLVFYHFTTLRTNMKGTKPNPPIQEKTGHWISDFPVVARPSEAPAASQKIKYRTCD